jgi:hypothetical protein
VAETDLQSRHGQGQSRDGLAHVTELGGSRAHEPPSDRRVEKEIPDFDAGARRAIPRAHRGQFAAVTGDLRALLRVGGPRLQSHLGDTADRRQCLTSEAERGDTVQIIGVGQFAGGVAGEGERQVGGGNAVAVVDDADQVGAALLQIDFDSPAAGVDRVFQQFLDDARRSFDHFAGGDFRHDQGRQLPDAGHALGIAGRAEGRNVGRGRARRRRFSAKSP